MGPLGNPCQHYRSHACCSASGLVSPPQVSPVLDVKVVSRLDERKGLRDIASLERVHDRALVADLHDGAAQNRVIVSAQFAQDSANLNHVGEGFLQLML